MSIQLSVTKSPEELRPSQASPHQLLPIEVTLDPAALTLTVAPFKHELGDGIDVVWRFFHLQDGSRVPGLPPGWTPNLFFFDGPKDSRPGRPPLYTGPFSGLLVNPLGVLGRGSSGLKGKYLYRALAVDTSSGGGGIIASSDQMLMSVAAERLMMPQVSVSVDLMRQQFEVFPLELSLYPEEPLSWVFVDLPSGFRPGIRFKSPDVQPLSTDFFFGPFQSLRITERKVTGIGRNGSVGSFGYSVFLVDAGGDESELIGSTDPHIDTEPDPFSPP